MVHQTFGRLQQLIVRGNKAHFDVEHSDFTDMARGYAWFGAVGRPDLKYTFKRSYQHLLVQLRRLGQGSFLTEVISLKDFCSALGRSSQQLRGLNFDKLICGQVIAE